MRAPGPADARWDGEGDAEGAATGVGGALDTVATTAIGDGVTWADAIEVLGRVADGADDDGDGTDDVEDGGRMDAGDVEGGGETDASEEASALDCRHKRRTASVVGRTRATVSLRTGDACFQAMTTRSRCGDRREAADDDADFRSVIVAAFRSTMGAAIVAGAGEPS